MPVRAPVIPDTPEATRRRAEAEIRRQHRLAVRDEIKKLRLNGAH